MELVTYAPADNNDAANSDEQPNKRRRKKSIVWEHFTIETINADCVRACCKQCKKSFAYITGSKLAGTSHLKRHIALGICPVSRLNQEKSQPPLYIAASKTDGTAGHGGPPRKRSSAGSANTSFDQELSHYKIAMMIILHDYPLDMVEHSGFVDFVQTLQPRFNRMNINTIQEYCASIYLREKKNLLNLLAGIPGRVSLTLDLWTSDQSIGYVGLTGHFMDNEWKLQRRILKVVRLPFPESEVSFSHAVAACLTDWSLESKLFTITLDQSIANDTVKGDLRGFLSIRNPLVLNGQLIIGNCFARVLSCLAKDAVDSMKGSINKVRECVKYVKTSEGHEDNFLEIREQLQVPSTKMLIIDDQIKWDTTYHMLIAASESKEVFSCLDNSDPNYKEAPSRDEWKQVETLCTYLKLLFDAANMLTSPSYPTANTFFHEAWKLQLDLTQAALSPDPLVSNLARPLQEKFDTYWRQCSLVLAIAVVMDPRFKMKLLEFSFSRIYGEDAEGWIKIIDEGVRELFLEYIVQSLPPPTFVEGGNVDVSKIELPEENLETEICHDETLLSTVDGLSDFDVYISEIMGSQQMKSELDEYLEESLVPRVQEFDVLGWWKLNKAKYPTLSKMASDILSIPVSTVAPDSVFDTVNKKVDSYRCSLGPGTLEALICAKDWLQCGSHGFPDVASGFSNAIVKVEF